jgi:predicted patatin/cPLA2 family phospholipase
MSGNFCIVAPGGGMTAVYNVGVIQALEKYFGLSRLGRVVSNSGAAGCYAYWIGGQQNDIQPLWENLVQSREFLLPLWQCYRRGSMNINFMIDEVVRRRFPLDVVAVLDSQIELDIAVTQAQTGESAYFSKSAVGDFFQLLRATSAMPYFFGEQVMLNDDYWYDGGIGSVVGIEQTTEEKNILFVLTRPPRLIKKLTLARGILRWLLLRKEHPDLQAVVMTMPARMNAAMQAIHYMQAKKNIVVIQPQERLPIRRIDTSLARLRATIRQGYQDVISRHNELNTFMQRCE